MCKTFKYKKMYKNRLQFHTDLGGSIYFVTHIWKEKAIEINSIVIRAKIYV